jgi:hypothetical protein
MCGIGTRPKLQFIFFKCKIMVDWHITTCFGMVYIEPNSNPI